MLEVLFLAVTAIFFFPAPSDVVTVIVAGFFGGAAPEAATKTGPRTWRTFVGCDAACATKRKRTHPQSRFSPPSSANFFLVAIL